MFCHLKLLRRLIAKVNGFSLCCLIIIIIKTQLNIYIISFLAAGTRSRNKPRTKTMIDNCRTIINFIIFCLQFNYELDMVLSA